MARAFPPSLFNPFLLWLDVAVKTGEMLFASGQVIGTRVGLMARAGPRPSARDRREMMLMGSEKLQAATESGLAVAARLQATQWHLVARAWQQGLASLGAMNALVASRNWGEVLARQHSLANALTRSGRTHARLSSDTARLAAAALKPLHGASTANARRLARARTRPATRR